MTLDLATVDALQGAGSRRGRPASPIWRPGAPPRTCRSPRTCPSPTSSSPSSAGAAWWADGDAVPGPARAGSASRSSRLVVAMYLLKLRRDERVVPSTLLWQRLARGRRGQRPVAAPAAEPAPAAPAAARARPRPPRRAAVPRAAGRASRATSSSSSTRRRAWPPATSRPSRMTEAKARRAIDALRDLPAGGHVSVIAAGRTARVVANATTDLGRVRSAIESIAPEPAPRRPRRRARASPRRSRRGPATRRSSSRPTARSRPPPTVRVDGPGPHDHRSAASATTRRSSRSRSGRRRRP